MSNGGFSYWPGGTDVSEWVTNYAGHFMLEAEKLGYVIPGNVKANWTKYQKEKSTKLSPLLYIATKKFKIIPTLEPSCHRISSTP